MNKPDDIPQDIWETATRVMDNVQDLVGEYQNWQFDRTVEVAAYALLAERERCAASQRTYDAVR